MDEWEWRVNWCRTRGYLPYCAVNWERSKVAWDKLECSNE